MLEPAVLVYGLLVKEGSRFGHRFQHLDHTLILRKVDAEKPELLQRLGERCFREGPAQPAPVIDVDLFHPDVSVNGPPGQQLAEEFGVILPGVAQEERSSADNGASLSRRYCIFDHWNVLLVHQRGRPPRFSLRHFVRHQSKRHVLKRCLGDPPMWRYCASHVDHGVSSWPRSRNRRSWCLGKFTQLTGPLDPIDELPEDVIRGLTTAVICPSVVGHGDEGVGADAALVAFTDLQNPRKEVREPQSADQIWQRSVPRGQLHMVLEGAHVAGRNQLKPPPWLGSDLAGRSLRRHSLVAVAEPAQRG
eukprot:scaffold516_cov270-Pinguiococcus_pyrenoidosus.AAC.5